MGCFSFECDGCHGHKCNQDGGQNGDCKAIIEVPLSDGTNVYLKGDYDEYGSVVIKFGEETYEFLPIQFQEYFKDWLGRDKEKYRKLKFLGGKVYTYSYKEYVEDDDNDRNRMVTRCSECQPYGITVNTLTKELLAKCIRADKGMNLPTEEQELINDIKDAKDKLEEYKKGIPDLEQKIIKLEEQLKKIEPPKLEQTTTRKRNKSPKNSNV